MTTLDAAPSEGANTSADDGNPVRLQSGPLAIRSDDGWRDGLSRSRPRLARLITYPLMRRYGCDSDGAR